MDNEGSKRVSRRDFMTKLWGIVVALPFAYSALKFILPPRKPFISSGQLSDTDNMTLQLDSIPVNSSKIVNINGEPVIIIRGPEKDIAAFSAVCTHLGCVVGFRKDAGDIYCACHGGRYDLNGNVIEGPPKTPLAKFKVTLENNKINVSPAG